MSYHDRSSLTLFFHIGFCPSLGACLNLRHPAHFLPLEWEIQHQLLEVLSLQTTHFFVCFAVCAVLKLLPGGKTA